MLLTDRERKIYALGVRYAEGELTDVQLNWRLNELGLKKEEFVDKVEEIGRRITRVQIWHAARLLFWLVVLQLLIYWFLSMHY